MASKDYYQVLGLKSDAKPEDIKKSFHKLARQYHPDKNPGNKAAEQRFKEISEAHEVLSDPAKRTKYDQLRDLESTGGMHFGSGGGGSGMDFGDLFRRGKSSGLGGLSDIFESLFRGGSNDRAPHATPPPSQKGEDIHQPVTIPFETAVTGGKVTLTIQIESTCGTCKGKGAAPGSKVTECTECEGKGQRTVSQGGFVINQPCPNCFGRGEIFTTPCVTCKGRRTTQRPEKVAVTIPRGIEDGKMIRLPGMGKPGIGKGGPGDLLLKISVEEHPQFKRRGNDLHTRVSVNAFQAMLGTKVSVTTLTGTTVAMMIPAGTQPGAKMRLKGEGLSGGDLYVEIDVSIPKVGPKEKEALTNLAREARIPL